METALEQILVGAARKDEMLAFMREQPGAFGEALQLAASDHPRFGWRAAWMVESCMTDNDRRVRAAIPALIAALQGAGDGHQRELLKILLRMELGDEAEGRLFAACMEVWEDPDKKPGTRGTAMELMLNLAEKYPDLKGELGVITQEPYLRSLSPGIRRVLKRRIRQVVGAGRSGEELD